ncbi:MAG: hypothetical protein EOM12_01500 [Verrucomicrobiae bacterium]|nr:hypothetical protein [Verrucomicrobiae bacterium]
MGNSKFVMGVIVLVLAICGSGYWVKASLDKSKQSQAQLAKEHSAEQALLEAKLEEARVRLSAETAQKDLQKLAPLDPKFLIQRLIELEMEKTESDKNYRAFYCLQGLADAGTNALPAIKDFFISGVDTDLELPYFRDPHTLRQEIAAILCGMRTMESAALLSQLLPVTQTATELENLCKVLLEISPETYHSHCVKAARNMYRETMKQTEKYSAERAELQRQLADNPDASVELRKAYSESSRNADKRQSDIPGIYNLLFRTLKDTEFAHTLMEEGAWMTKNDFPGIEVVNTFLFSSTRELLGEESIQWYHAAFLRMREKDKAGEKTDEGILFKSRIFDNFFEDVALSYAGINPMATEMYLTLLRGDNDKSHQESQYRLVSDLENVFDYFATEPTQSFTGERKQSFITARLGVLDTIAAEYANDELMQEVIDLTRANLERQTTPDAEPEGEFDKAERERLAAKIKEMSRQEKFEELEQSIQESLDEMKKDILETKEK